MVAYLYQLHDRNQLKRKSCLYCRGLVCSFGHGHDSEAESLVCYLFGAHGPVPDRSIAEPPTPESWPNCSETATNKEIRNT